MMDIQLIQITEHLPPTLDGIGDYAYILASEFKEAYSIDTSFIVLNSLQDNIEIIQNFSVYSLSTHQLSLLDTLNTIIKKNQKKRNIIVLHYNKGFYDRYLDIKKYESNFFPLNLLEILRKIKHQGGIASKLIIVFHEFLFPRIERRRDYVLRPLQNLFMKKVVQFSDIAICNNPASARQIFKLDQKAKIFICPVFSNIGELYHNPIESKQEGTWVIFGSNNSLMNTLNKFVQYLPIIKNSFQINTIHILGGKRNDVALNLTKEINKYIPNVNYLPEIPSQEVSDIFKVSRFCYMHYFDQNLLKDSTLIFKSGVFAAACSHGVIPVFSNPGMEHVIGECEHPGFIFLKDGKFNIQNSGELNEISLKIFDWYQQKSSMKITANVIYESM